MKREAMNNVMRAQAMAAMSSLAQDRFGIVSSFDPATYSAKVMLQPEGTETGWLPVGSMWVGNGWGMFAPPPLGTMVAVGFQEGSNEAGFVRAGYFNDEDRPLPVQAGEMWLVHSLGAAVKLTNDGKGIFTDGHGASITLNGDGTLSSTGEWTHTGALSVTGDVVTTGALTNNGKSVGSTLRVSGVTPGVGNSGGPI